MINNLKIKNFKSLVDEEFEFKKLTILAGTNSSGKSSTIQSILLYSSEITRERYSSLSKYLNFLKKDKSGLLNFNIGARELSIQINRKSKLNYKKGDRVFNIGGEIEDGLSYESSHLIYLCADRIGTREFYLKNDNPEIEKIGIYGEYAMDYFEYHKSEPIEEYLMVDKNAQTLELNVNYWLYHIVNSELRTEDGGDDIKAFFAYKIDEKSKPRFVNPKNIGSGTGYLISMIIACLSAKKDDIIIIENPEIHLHPKAQSQLGEFFAFITSKGVQLIIETHNDHIINRICYEEYMNTLDSKEVVIFYKNDILTPFEKIEIKEGQFINSVGDNQFPEGFFDATLQEIFEING
jgi:predicted ATPase